MTDNKSITPYNRLKELLRNDEIRERFDAILRDRAPAFLGSLLNIVSQDGKLQECEPVSVLNCAMKAAVFGLPIEPQLGFAWIIPRWNGKARKLIANFQFGYKGLVQLALQTGLYRSINAGEVYEGEQVTQDRISGMITITGERSGNGVLGYFAYIELMTGFRHLEYWELAAVREHAEKYSESWGKDSSAWSTNFGQMAKKTVLTAALKKYGLLVGPLAQVDDLEAPGNGNGHSEKIIDGISEDISEP